MHITVSNPQASASGKSNQHVIRVVRDDGSMRVYAIDTRDVQAVAEAITAKLGKAGKVDKT